MKTILKIVLILFAAILATSACASLTYATPTITIDKPDCTPRETATISGSGFVPGMYYYIPVIRPDGSIVIGDGSFVDGWDTVQADAEGKITYYYVLNGINGLYEVRVYDSPWSGDLSEITLASTTFTDFSVDFSQYANLDDQWINGILQSSNSRYSEGMSVPQRLMFIKIAATSGNVHTVDFAHMATKGGIHTYDWLTSWNQGNVPPLTFVPWADLKSKPYDWMGEAQKMDTLAPGYSDIYVNVPGDPFACATSQNFLRMGFVYFWRRGIQSARYIVTAG